MIRATERAAAALIRKTTSQLDVTLPKPLTAAYQRHDQLVAGAGQFAPPPGALAAAIVAAIADDRDPTADPAVTRHVVAERLANEGVRQAVVAHAHGELRDTIATHADDIIGLWRNPFDTAAATLTAAADRLGDVELADAPTILRQGGDAADHWAAAQTAVTTIDRIRHGWAALHELTHGSKPNPRRAALIIADVHHQLTGRGKPDPWRLTHDGYPLRLPTLTEYRTAAAAADKAQQQASAAAQAQRAGSTPVAVRLR